MLGKNKEDARVNSKLNSKNDKVSYDNNVIVKAQLPGIYGSKPT